MFAPSEPKTTGNSTDDPVVVADTVKAPPWKADRTPANQTRNQSRPSHSQTPSAAAAASFRHRCCDRSSSRSRVNDALHRHEVEVVATAVQGELEDAVRRIVLDQLLAAGVVNDVWFAPPVPTMNSVMPLVGSACPRRVLGSEALVGVIVPGQDHVGVRVVELLHDRRGVGGGTAAARPQGDVPVGEQALVLVRREIACQPASLRARRTTPPGVAAVRVDRDQVPATDVEAVPTLAGRSLLAAPE